MYVCYAVASSWVRPMQSDLLSSFTVAFVCEVSYVTGESIMIRNIINHVVTYIYN